MEQGNGLEARVNAERGEDAANVVSNRLDRQMEFVGDLSRRAAVFEQTQNLGLAGCQVRMSSRRWLIPLDLLGLAEHPDHVVAPLSGVPLSSTATRSPSGRRAAEVVTAPVILARSTASRAQD